MILSLSCLSLIILLQSSLPASIHLYAYANCMHTNSIKYVCLSNGPTSVHYKNTLDLLTGVFDIADHFMEWRMGFEAPAFGRSPLKSINGDVSLQARGILKRVFASVPIWIFSNTWLIARICAVNKENNIPSLVMFKEIAATTLLQFVVCRIRVWAKK